MTAANLIKLLQAVPPDAEIKIEVSNYYDDRYHEPVTVLRPHSYLNFLILEA